jgi:hypothetical protein
VFFARDELTKGSSQAVVCESLCGACDGNYPYCRGKPVDDGCRLDLVLGGRIALLLLIVLFCDGL